MSRATAIVLTVCALGLLGLALVPGNPAATPSAVASGLLGAAAYVQWRGPRKG